ncbi:MAG TPA: Clp protease N-terminal domain-containing protein [Hyphomicrobiaceae bacterium]|nr:Clp protease N-terminal domain-containing protein [Hyphomicrobiaceae bacterium]
MGYRGHDLDLRTPQTWRDVPRDLAGAGKALSEAPAPARGRGYSGDEEIPIWVDDTVLACCNHAFDVALAHRSAEVRIEHLLHALTRIEEAAEILEANGVRAASLRRETATVIAGEIPVSLTNGTAVPRRADSFEEVLRLAAAHAYQHGQPVGVENLLHVFLDLRPAIRGLELIERHLVARRRERVERPMPAFRRPAAPSFPPPPMEQRFEPRERIRRPAGRFHAPDADFTSPAARPPMPAVAPVSENFHAATDQRQNLRIEALEQMVRVISEQIAGQREEATRFAGGISDQLKSLETMVSLRPESASIDLDPLAHRIDGLEGVLKAYLQQPGQPPVDLAPVLEHITQLDRRLGLIGPAAADVDLVGVEQRLTDIEAQIKQTFAELERRSDPAEISARLDVIEQALLSRDGGVGADIDNRMRDLSEAVSLQQATLEDTRASLAADVRDVNSNLADQGARMSATTDSLTELVRAVESLRNEERNTVGQIASLLSTYRSEVHEHVAHAEEARDLHNGNLKEVHEALVKLNQNQHTLAGSIDQWRSDESGDLAIIASRIEGLEQQAGRPMALLEGMSVNLENMNRYTVERYHRRNRFWYWLFGTDDWVAASWPSQAERIEAERAALRAARSN